jgi:F-type H+-transporting ATPase subunit a
LQLTPDEVIYWSWGVVTINATLVFTWVAMLVMVTASWIVSRALVTGPGIGRGQAALEIVVVTIRKQIEEATAEDPDRYVPFIGTLFLFITISTLLGAIPGVHVVAASLSTTAALATCVFFAVPLFGISREGVGPYLRRYVEPSIFMLPFHIIGELSRTLSLAVRLFGNLMSGKVIVGILLSIIPFLFPAIMEAFGLLIGVIQAYVFAILALVYIGSGSRASRASRPELPQQQETPSEDRPTPDPSRRTHG